jgi:hypothetical protein
MLVLLLLLVLEFGLFIESRLIITNVSREGASIASREPFIDQSITALLRRSGVPLNLAGANGEIIVTRVTAGDTQDEPSPRISARVSSGDLGVNSSVGETVANMGLTPEIYGHLVFNPDIGTSDIADVTVVEVYYRYRPVTPIGEFARGMLNSAGDGVVISSRAIF